MIRKLITLAGIGLAVLFASQSHAATATFDFTTETTIFTASPMPFSEGGLSVDVSSAMYVDPSVWDNGAVRTELGKGLGVRFGAGDQDLAIDAEYGKDLVIFDFSEDVSLKSITFTGFDDGERFLVFNDNAVEGNLQPGDLLNASPSGIFDLSTLGPEVMGDLFAIGALTGSSSFYIAELTVEYGNISAVPLPPAMLLFAGALGGLGWIARRRKTDDVS